MFNKIGWCTTTWNPVTGCTPCSPACDHCYAKGIATRFKGKKGHGNGFEIVTCYPERLDQPSKWNDPQRVFVLSMGDLFHKDVPNEFVEQVFQIMEDNPQHTFLVLTKRPEMIKVKLSNPKLIENVWLGVTVENQEYAIKRIPELLKIPAAGYFVSVEPMLGPVDLTPWLDPSLISWVIVGGETGPGAREMKPEWAIPLRDQCKHTGIPFWFKGWGRFTTKSLKISKEDHKKMDGSVYLELPKGMP